MKKIVILLPFCEMCGCEVTVDAARVDDPENGVIEYSCPNCGEGGILKADVQEVVWWKPLAR